MEKFIPYEKLSKKEKRRLDSAKRGTWGELNPATRKPQNSKAYTRSKARNWKRDDHETSSGSFLIRLLNKRNAGVSIQRMGILWRFVIPHTGRSPDHPLYRYRQ